MEERTIVSVSRNIEHSVSSIDKDIGDKLDDIKDLLTGILEELRKR